MQPFMVVRPECRIILKLTPQSKTNAHIYKTETYLELMTLERNTPLCKARGLEAAHPVFLGTDK